MKYLIGFIAGVGAAWAALAIWQHRSVPDWKTEAWNAYAPRSVDRRMMP